MANLLTLTFHEPDERLREDALFKYHADKTKLLEKEALGENFDEDLEHKNKYGPASGLIAKKYKAENSAAPNKVTQITLNGVGFNAWWREPFKSSENQKSKFEKWIEPKISKRCDCLVLAGHHSYVGSGNTTQVVLWGQEDSRYDNNRWFTALVPKLIDGKPPQLEIRGHPYKGTSDVLRAGPFDFGTTLKHCCLIVIMGCNGTGWRKGVSGTPLGRYWQNWVERAPGRTQMPPIILGWYGLHSMPDDELEEHFSEALIKSLINKFPDKTLEEICEKKPDDVIKCWGTALKKTYRTSAKQKHLWFDDYRGGGAIGRDGKMWKVLKDDGEIEKVDK